MIGPFIKIGIILRGRINFVAKHSLEPEAAFITFEKNINFFISFYEGFCS